MAPQINNVSCEVCRDVITQPVCPECLEKEMVEWLIYKKGKNIELINFIKKTTKSFEAYGYIDTKCIICGEKMRVCAHCYCKEIFDYINGRYPELEEEFITHFDFNIHFKMKIT